MAKYVILIGAEEPEQPAENYGCSCPACRARWQERTIFQNRLVVELCTQRPDIPTTSIWPTTVAVCNILERQGVKYPGLKFRDLEIRTQAEIEQHPELIHGAPSGATLQ